jgi:hypothetical protein
VIKSPAMNRLLAFLLLFTLALPANAARPLLGEFLARAPAGAGEPTMSALALEACLRQARELERSGEAIDHYIAAIDREAAEGMFLQRQLDAEMPRLRDYDEAALTDYQRRVIRHETLAKKFQAEFPRYQQKQRAHEMAIAAFERDCAQAFTAGDLAAVKAKLGIP